MIRPACRVSDRLVESEKHGIVAFIISALHASRRRLASRVIRQCEHLLGNEAKKRPENKNGDEQSDANKIGGPIPCPQ
ncbi:hypothetical protein [Bradyrhizobium canariense]|uniref:hypothetical protein n=1 Tax=Bradyrhizobium canariense TaxID=255045 RepID=UPI00117829C6|nr:hypothetical protein [Bradyrhizobium canariense]